MSTETCYWSELFDEDERNNLQEGFLITGLLSVVLGSWLNLCLLSTKLRENCSYKNMANLTVVACVRRIMAVIPHLSLVMFFKNSQAFQTLFCNFFGFVETFLAVYEVESLTHICIERYVIAKYTTNGWPINKNHYSLFLYLCLLFAVTYSFLPLFGLGRYGYDFSCTSCTFDMVLPDSWQRYFIVAVFILRSVKSVMTMLMMLTWAHLLERKYTLSVKNRKHIYFTRNVTIVTLVNLVCWTPIALIRGVVVFYQLFYIDPIVMTSIFYIKWAMWIHWVAPAMTTVALFIVDDRIRNKMIHICSAEYDDEEDYNKKE